MRDLRDLNRFRDRHAETRIWGYRDMHLETLGGYFLIPSKTTRRDLKVIVSTSDAPGSEGWDHVSVSLPNRCPNWPEMDEIKRLFFLPEEVCFQLHPAESEHISNHPFCLHIWRHESLDVPLPPSLMVGSTAIGELSPRTPYPVAAAAALAALEAANG